MKKYYLSSINSMNGITTLTVSKEEADNPMDICIVETDNGLTIIAEDEVMKALCEQTLDMIKQ